MSDCAHPDVRYFAEEKGAVACCECGRLFGHLIGETFIAFNPESPTSIERGYVRAHENGGHAKYGAIKGCPLCAEAEHARSFRAVPTEVH